MSHTLHIVEDDASLIKLLRSVFEGDYALRTDTSAEDCLARLDREGPPDVFLLDVGLPGQDGFSLCEQIKQRPDCAAVPVMFVSGQVEIDARLRGLEVGAHDFLVKPFDVREVRQKVALLLKEREEKARLQSQLTDSDTLTSLILSNLDEYAVLLKFLRELNSCEAPEQVIELTHQMLRGYGLAGAVQLRLPTGECNADAQGESTPIMVSILNHVRTMDRIFEFRKRGVYNFDRITVLVENMPVADPELCGRLRDHLAIAFETADARLAGLIAAVANTQAQGSISDVIDILQGTLASFAERYEQAQQSGGAVMHDLQAEMRGAFAHLGMSMLQEEALLEMVQTKANVLVQIYNSGDAMQATLADLQQHLAELQRTLRGG